jgi:hypothetical protein
MRRALPGFGVVDFGGGGKADAGLAGAEHVLDAEVDNNTAVAVRLRTLAGHLLGAGRPQDRQAALDTAARVALECADAVLKLAFRVDPDGDPVLIGECKRLLRLYLQDHLRD